MGAQVCISRPETRKTWPIRWRGPGITRRKSRKWEGRPGGSMSKSTRPKTITSPSCPSIIKPYPHPVNLMTSCINLCP